MQNFEDDESTFFERHRGKFFALVVLGIGGAGVWLAMKAPEKKAKAPEISMVDIVAPPPAPPPPPPPPPPKAPEPPPPEETKQEEFVKEEAPTETPPEPDPTPEPAPAMATGVQGNGPPDGFGLSNRGGSGLPGGSGFGGRGNRAGSKYGWYAGKVQTSVAEALRNNKTTRTARMSIQVKIWSDTLGRVTKAQLVESSGSPEVDRALREQVLVGLQLPEAPPSDMPMPINLRISARAPGPSATAVTRNQ